jgi:predicted nucleic acid-binding protein
MTSLFRGRGFRSFYVPATRRGKPDRLTDQQATSLVEAFLRFPVQETTVALLRAALEAARRFQVSFWDAAIIEAARILGCSTVLSEDLSDRQNCGGVAAVNPFRKNRST